MSSSATPPTRDTDIDKDANVLMMELNKGLQSPNLGEQCKAIAQFPNLLEKYPFPVVVNSVFLKITQIFCDGNNYLRLCVLRSCHNCRSHLEKLTVCDDVVRKLMPFTASNDPVTRALTLRLFGTLSLIAREHIGVHHAVLKELESHYAVESDAAIWSSHQLASISSSFAISLCPILCRRLTSHATDLDVKLKLIRLGRHMHHDIESFEKMRRCLIEMLAVYGTTEFVLCILETTTHLESLAPVHICDQLDLLIGYLSRDERPTVRQKVLENLVNLANRVPHHWEKHHVMKLCSHYLSVKEEAIDERQCVLHILLCLASSPRASEVLQSCLSEPGGITQCVKIAICDFPATLITLKGFQLVCRLAMLLPLAQDSADSDVFLSPGQIVCYLVAHFTFKQPNLTEPSSPWFLASNGMPFTELKQFYSLVVQFFAAFPEYTVCISRMNLFSHVRLTGDPRLGLLCQFLNTLASQSYFCMRSKSNAVVCTPATLLSQLQLHQPCGDEDVTHNLDMQLSSILSACGLLFLLCGGVPLRPTEQRALFSAITEALHSTDHLLSDRDSQLLNPWLAYQLARQASRYGQHDLSSKIFAKLIPFACSERTSHWLNGLAEFSRLEAQLLSVLRPAQRESLVDDATTCAGSESRGGISCMIDAVRQTADALCHARTSFICVGGPDTRWFQAEYVGIRSGLYLCLAELCAMVSNQTRVNQWFAQFCPAPSESRESIAEPRQVPSAPPVWLSGQIEMWTSLEDRVSSFRSQCLDADHATLHHLDSIVHVISFFVRLLEAIRQNWDNSLQDPSPQLFSYTSPQPNGDPFSRIIPELTTLAQARLRSDSRNFDWLAQLALRVAGISSHWPRFFFQRLQTTTVRLVLLPKAGNNPDDILTIGSGVGHMIQVMGVVQQRTRLPDAQVVRRIQAVEVELVVTECLPHDRHRSHRPTLTEERTGQIVFYSKRSAQLQRDYFHCEFCVQFPTPTVQTAPDSERGPRPLEKLYNVQATPILLDAAGCQWRLTHASGAPKESTLVRVESMSGTGLSAVSTTQPVPMGPVVLS